MEREAWSARTGAGRTLDVVVYINIQQATMQMVDGQGAKVEVQVRESEEGALESF